MEKEILKGFLALWLIYGFAAALIVIICNSRAGIAEFVLCSLVAAVAAAIVTAVIAAGNKRQEKKRWE